MDTWWSHTLDLSPSICSQNLDLAIPGPTNLFEAASAKAWSRLIDGNVSIFINSAVIENCPLEVRLPRMDDPSPTGIVGLLSIVWARVREASMSNMRSTELPVSCSSGVPVLPQTVLASHASGKRLVYILYQVYAKYAGFLRSENANCLTLWHFLHLNTLADVGCFELAAGHSGAECARTALQNIAEWSQTSAARRACLHAAGIYSTMSRRRIHDCTMFHSEPSLFFAALVLGLYVFMMQPTTNSGSDSSQHVAEVDPYELLQDVDWQSLRDDSVDEDLSDLLFRTTSSSGSTNDATVRKASSATQHFITYGGSVSFAGFTCMGGYEAAKMILHEFASLLEESGRWKAKQFCYILRIMSDSLLDMDDN